MSANIHEKLSWALDSLKASITPEIPKLPPVLKVYSDLALVLTDLHIPMHSHTWTKLALRRAAYLKRKFPELKLSLLIGGDLLNLTMFGRHGHTERDVNFRHTLQVGAKVLDAFAHVVDEIVICPGNHDARLVHKMRAMTGGFGFHEIMSMIIHEMTPGIIAQENLIYTERNFFIYNDQWAIVHPKNYSKIPGKVPRDLAQIHQLCVVSGHTHHAPCAVATHDGRFMGLENGCMLDISNEEYLQDMDSYPHHKRGFTELIKAPDGVTRYRQHSEMKLNLDP